MASTIHVAAQFLRPGNGGIAEVARVSMKALAGAGPTLGHACLEREDYQVGDARARAYGASRARFQWGLERAVLAGGRLLFDFAGTARAARWLWPHRPYAVWTHGIEVWDDVRADRADALARAELVLVNSAYTRARAEPTLGRLKDVRLCRLGSFSDDEIAPVPRDGPPTALLLGRVEPGWPKGQGIMVEIWPRVVAAVPDARLKLVGKGPALDALRDLAKASPAAASIEVAGFVPEADIEAVWASATVFAMPSLTEGFGLVFIEAMRRGLPVISSRSDAGSEVNLDGQTGYAVSRDDRERLVEALVAVLRDRDLGARLGAAGAARWRAEFRFSAFEKRFLAALGGFVPRQAT
jgi:phosphatidylinositol alpha-1,6-mannosyltransferase